MKQHPFVHLQKRQDLKDCCRNMLNLNVQQTARDVLKARCTKCAREHIKMRAEPFRMISRFKWEKRGKILVPKA